MDDVDIDTWTIVLSIYILQWIVILTGIYIYVASVGGWPFRSLFGNWTMFLMCQLLFWMMVFAIWIEMD